MPDFKLLLHVPEKRRFNAALMQAKNFILAKENEKITVRVLLNSDGVKILDDLEQFEDIFKEALNLGIEIYFCENALKQFKIPMNRIPNGGKTLPAGIVAIVNWQMQGFVYIRA